MQYRFSIVWSLVAAILFLAGCSTVTSMRFDQEIGQHVDEASLHLQYPLCLMADPNFVLYNKAVGDNYRLSRWTKPSGEVIDGKWYMYKKSNHVVPTRDNVEIYVQWEENSYWDLSDFESCAVLRDRPSVYYGIDLEDLWGITSAFDFQDGTTAELWIKDHPSTKRKTLIIKTYGKNVSRGSRDVGSPGVEMWVLDVDCGMVENKMPDYESSRAYYSYVACYDAN